VKPHSSAVLEQGMNAFGGSQACNLLEIGPASD
jgi:hypothetical protein